MSPISSPACAAGLPAVRPTTRSAVSIRLVLAGSRPIARTVRRGPGIRAFTWPCSRISFAAFADDGRWNDDTESANFCGSRQAEEFSVRVRKRAASESAVHRRRRADDLINRLAAPRRQRTANHRDVADRGGDGVAPRSADGEREMSDARRRIGQRNRRHVQVRATRSTARCGGRIPAGQLGLERSTIRCPHAHAVLVDPARGPSSRRRHREGRRRWRDAGVREPVRPKARRHRRHRQRR